MTFAKTRLNETIEYKLNSLSRFTHILCIVVEKLLLMDRVLIVLSYVCPFSMAENGDVDSVEPMEQGDTATETMETEERTEDYQKLVDYGISEKVASELDKIYKSGKLTKRP